MGVFKDLGIEYWEYLQTNALFVAAGAAIILAWIASGAFSSSIAESRRRSPLLHFIVGLFVPVLYPLAIQFAMSVKTESSKSEKKEQDKAKERFEKMPGAPPVETSGLSGALHPVDEVDIAAESSLGIGLSATVGSQYDQAYFKRIARDEMGAARGPFLLTLEDGQVRAEHILSCDPKVVIIERIGSDGRSTKLRVPYEKIENCVEI